MDIAEIGARLEIQQQLANYANGYDNCDWDLYQSVFTPDADVDYTNSIPLRGTPADIVKEFAPNAANIAWAQHYITNVSYEFESPERAKVQAMFYNPCQLKFTEEVSHFYGHYDHVFVKTAQGWKSEHLVEHMHWHVNAPAGFEQAAVQTS
jgi:hypothetical protein